MPVIFAGMLLSTGYIIVYIFCIVPAILIFYYLYFFARLAFYESRPVVAQQEKPLSVIICGRNEEKNFERNIPAVLAQEYDVPVEVLAVNDNSEDNTKLVLQWMARGNERLRVLNLERAARLSVGKKYPLSIGIREAKHDILLLTDADCIPASPQWAKKMQSVYDNDDIEIVLGYGAYEKHPGLLNKLIRFETFHSALQYLSYALAGMAYMGVGRNLSYKKELFFRYKGFASINHIPGGDDDLFINKVATPKNTAIQIDGKAHTISVPPKSWSDWRRQKTRHYSTSKYYKTKHKWLLGLYSFSQFLFYPLLITTAIVCSWQLALGIFVVKSVAQYLVFSNAMAKLNERELTKWIFVMDLWMFFYYLLFAHTLWRKEDKKW